MRDIKFRAWDKKNKFMDTVDGYNLFIADGKLYEVTEKGGWDRYMDRENVTDDYELMQYTGLKDKNGKEIYEGDVVKILHGEWMSQHLGNDEQKAMTHEQYLDSLTKQYEVVFATDRFMGKRHIGYNPWETDQEGYKYTRLTPDKYGYVEVIGNIYENPDLIKQ